MTQYHESPETQAANARRADFSAAAQYAAQEAKAADPIEQEIQAKGLTAPRITPADIEANIASEHYFTAADGVGRVTDDMVCRFLGWKLPKDFGPDAGISFNPTKPDSYDEPGWWPVGTNLLTADQARQMLQHVVDPKPAEPALGLLTFCVLVLNNGFTVTGESACASPENFDAEIGKKIARQNAINKVWPLMGYELRSMLATGLTRAE